MKVLRFWWVLPLTAVSALVIRAGITVVPESWPSFQDALHPRNAAQVDSGLFDGDSTLEGGAVADTSVDAACHAAGEAVMASQVSVGTVRGHGDRMGLCSYELRTGRPLVEQIWELSQALGASGYTLIESNEKPLAKYCWLGRIARSGALQAVVRARMGDAPLPASSGVSLVMWADSLPAQVWNNLALLPRGIILALPPALLGSDQVQLTARQRGFHLAVLIRLETEHRPLILQQKTRILLHHTPREIAERLDIANASSHPVEGLVVLDGERGAEDPQLAARLASYAHGHAWWILDATQVSVSRLDSASRAEGVRVMPHPVPSQGPQYTLDAALQKAKSLGSSLCSLPLDPESIALVHGQIGRMVADGIVVRLPVLDTSRKESQWSISE